MLVSLFESGHFVVTLPGKKTIFAKDSKEIGIKLAQLGIPFIPRENCFLWEEKYFQGEIEHQDEDGNHLFTDRGNRLTFDREIVSDQVIRRTLVHALRQHGAPLSLTGDDPVFTERMERLAAELGIETTRG